MAEHGFTVVVCNRSPDKVDTTVARAKAEGDLPLYGRKDVSEFVAEIKKPRKIVILVQAGKPVDDTIEKLAEFMEEGDCIIDGGRLLGVALLGPIILPIVIQQTHSPRGALDRQRMVPKHHQAG